MVDQMSHKLFFNLKKGKNIHKFIVSKSKFRRKLKKILSKNFPRRTFSVHIHKFTQCPSLSNTHRSLAVLLSHMGNTAHIIYLMLMISVCLQPSFCYLLLTPSKQIKQENHTPSQETAVIAL